MPYGAGYRYPQVQQSSQDLFEVFLTLVQEYDKEFQRLTGPRVKGQDDSSSCCLLLRKLLVRGIHFHLLLSTCSLRIISKKCKHGHETKISIEPRPRNCGAQEHTKFGKERDLTEKQGNGRKDRS